ncbi:hypothetical protein KO500_11810 [Cellulophaga baltica]|uniref:hypothetical protein n=1 Tax=Cellulophaga TaxID=104264 RepID=UPI001C0688F7|nr:MULTISPECIES: hypothetical protein [Cellulophaga]MBU2997125.1 hypothetical protein [Cellulophaga baltica]MDO6768523.1 hypothetical protein [Cellulophaga sp. 1_MG-2023]
MKKAAEFYLDKNKIEIFNSLIGGKQRVLLNGNTVSEKRSFLNPEHYLTIHGENYYIQLKRRFFSFKKEDLKILKNSLPISLDYRKGQNVTSIFVLVIVLGLSLGFMVGLKLYEIIWHISM